MLTLGIICAKRLLFTSVPVCMCAVAAESQTAEY